jgi:hypothetical protein
MLEIKCPGCGAYGRVPRDKKNNRLVCKKCLRVFHLSPSGQAVLGEPPERKDAPVEQAAEEAGGFEFGGSLEDMVTRLTKFKFPKMSIRTLGTLAVLAVLGGLGYLFFSAQTLETRARIVARSIQLGEIKDIVDIAAPGTEMDAMMWSTKVIPRYNELKLALGGQDSGVSTGILADGSSGGPALVAVRFTAEGTRMGSAGVEAFHTTPSLSNTQSSYEVHLYWVKNMWGSWLLDGKRTAQDSP